MKASLWRVSQAAPQSVVDPRAGARTTRLLVSGLHERHGGVVIDRLGVDGANEGWLVRKPCRRCWQGTRRVREWLAAAPSGQG